MSKIRTGTEGSTCSLDVEGFIAEVRKYPVIWDLNCQDNRYKNKKQAAWDEIARKIIADFDALPELEKSEVYRRLHNKWRNIRDSYVRHIKRRDPKRGYMYARHLAFLNNIYNHVAYSTDDDDQDNDASEEEASQVSQRHSKRLEPGDGAWPGDAEDAGDLKRRRIKKETIEIEPFLADPACSYPAQLEDEDRSFFDSLLPAVRAFDLDQKLEFRCEVLKLVKNIRRTIKSDPISFD